MDVKTPISLLQEHLIKEGHLPNYRLIQDGTGTHVPLFQYEVTAKNISAIGKGKSKKEAKQDAAKLLLLQLKGENLWNENVPIVSPYADIIKQNAVGSLKDFCLQHNIPLPEYNIIRDEGLPHAKTFGMRCIVSSFITEAEARTKQQAKQLAAQQMLSKLQKCLEDGNVDMISNREKELTKTSIAYNLTENAYGEVLKKREENKVNDMLSFNTVGTFISNYADYFLKNVLPFSETLRALTNFNEKFFELHQNPEELLKAIMSQLDYDYNFSFLETKSEDNFLCNLQIRELNNANFMCLGKSQNSAKQNSIISALIFLTTMSKEF